MTGVNLVRGFESLPLRWVRLLLLDRVPDRLRDDLPVAEDEGVDPVLDDWSPEGGYLNPLAFQQPADGTFGNLGRNAIYGPGYWNVDFSIFKRFEIAGSSSLEFRAEAFNLLNSVYFGLPSTAVDTATGGRITSTSNAARQLQFGLKYLF